MYPDSLYRQILDHLNSAVILLDGDFCLRYMNPAAEALFEMSGLRLIGSPVQELFLEEVETDAQTLFDLARPYTKRKATLRLTHGKEIVVDYSVSPMQGADAMLLIEFQPIDRLLRIAREEAGIATSRANRVLVRGLALEIKNPLGGLRGAAQLLARELTDMRLHEYTDVIIEEADRLRNLVDRMLGPHRPPDLKPINVHEVVERVARLIQAEAGDAIMLVRDYDPSIPEIQADREQLIQALLNIVRNALEAITSSPAKRPGQIILRTRTVRQHTIGLVHHRLLCRIEVIDNGPGIPAEIMQNIFFPMVSGRAEGSGLGLSISQSIVHQHHGSLECDSEPGQTRFTLLIPIQDARGG